MKILQYMFVYALLVYATQWPLFQKQFRVKHFLEVLEKHDISHIWNDLEFHQKFPSKNYRHQSWQLQGDLQWRTHSSFSLPGQDSAFPESISPDAVYPTNSTVPPPKTLLQKASFVIATEVQAYLGLISKTYLKVFAESIWSSIIVAYLDVYWEGQSPSAICARSNADEVDVWKRESVACKRRIFNSVERMIVSFHALIWIFVTYCLHSYVWFSHILNLIRPRPSTTVYNRCSPATKDAIKMAS